MGAKLEQIFDTVERKAGNNGRLKLAQLTKMTKSQAKDAADTPELVANFKRIASEILGRNIDDLLS
jgi:hypothetical protein